MKVFKNLFGDNSKIHIDEIAYKDLNNIIRLLGWGIIAESGSNSNGNYVKFGDATMVCWNKCRLEHTGINIYLSTVWWYPQPFVEDPTLCLTRTPPVDTSIGIRDFGILSVTSLFPDRATLATYVSSSVDKFFSETDYITCSALAIGRWK